MFLRLGIAGLLIGGFMMFFGWQEWHLSSGASEKAEEMTLEALIKRGPDGNPNIVLTNFMACDNLVSETRRGSSSWERVWAPIIPAPGKVEEADLEKLLNPTTFHALVRTSHASDAQALHRVLDQDAFTANRMPKIQGMVVNKIQSLGSEERNILKQKYPQTDFEKCIIFEEGRKPGGMGYVMTLGGGGLAIFLVGGVLLVMGAKGG